MKIISTSERVQHEITEKECATLASAILSACLLMQGIPEGYETFRTLQAIATKLKELTDDELQSVSKADLN